MSEELNPLCRCGCGLEVARPWHQQIMGHSVNRKLLDEEVIAIQKFLSEGELTQRQIAKLFSVTQAVIGSIKYGVRTIERHPAKEILRASEIKEWADFRAAKKTVKILGKLLKEKYGIR